MRLRSAIRLLASASASCACVEAWSGRALCGRPRRDGGFYEFEAQSMEEVTAQTVESGDILLFESDPLMAPLSPLRAAERWLAKRAGGCEWDGVGVVLRSREEDAPYVLEHCAGVGFVLRTLEERLMDAEEPQVMLRRLRGPPLSHAQMDAADREAARLVGLPLERCAPSGCDADDETYDAADPDGRNAALVGPADAAAVGLLAEARGASLALQPRPWAGAWRRLARVGALARAAALGPTPSRVSDHGSAAFLRERALPGISAELAALRAELADSSRLGAARSEEERQAVVRHRVALRASIRLAEQRMTDGERQAEEAETRLRGAGPPPRGAVPLFPSAAAAAAVLRVMRVLPAGLEPSEYLPVHFAGKAPLGVEGGRRLGGGSFLLSRESERLRGPVQ